jgi:hypothetical protein
MGRCSFGMTACVDDNLARLRMSVNHAQAIDSRSQRLALLRRTCPVFIYLLKHALHEGKPFNHYTEPFRLNK